MGRCCHSVALTAAAGLALLAQACDVTELDARPASDPGRLWEACWDGDVAACLTLGRQRLEHPDAQVRADAGGCLAMACDYGSREACTLLWDLALPQRHVPHLDKTLNSDQRACQAGDKAACGAQLRHLHQAAAAGVHDASFLPRYTAALDAALRGDDPARDEVAATLARAACAIAAHGCLASARSLLTASPSPPSTARTQLAREVYGQACGRLGRLHGAGVEGRSGLQREHCANLLRGVADALGPAADELLGPLWGLACDQGSAQACGESGRWLWRDAPRDPAGWRALHQACLGAVVPAWPPLSQALAAIGAGQVPAESSLALLPDGCRWLLAHAVRARHGQRFARDDLQQLFGRQPWYPEDAAPTPLTEAERRLLGQLEESPRGSLLVDDFAHALRRGGVFVDAPRCFALRDSDAVRAWTEAGDTGTLLCRSWVAYESSAPRLSRVNVQATSRGGQLAVGQAGLREWNTCLLVPGALPLPTPSPRAGLEPRHAASVVAGLAERARASAVQQTARLRQEASPSGRAPCNEINQAADDYDGDGELEWVIELRCGTTAKPQLGMLGAYHYHAWPADRAPDESYRYYCDQGHDGALGCHLLGSYEAGPDCKNAHLTPGARPAAPDAGAAQDLLADPLPSSSSSSMVPGAPPPRSTRPPVSTGR